MFVQFWSPWQNHLKVLGIDCEQDNVCAEGHLKPFPVFQYELLQQPKNTGGRIIDEQVPIANYGPQRRVGYPSGKISPNENTITERQEGRSG